MQNNQQRNILMMNLRAARIQKGLSQTELAKRAGVELSLISRYEQCKTTPRPETLEKIAKALDCSAEQLYGAEGGYHAGNITREELSECAQPLVRLLQKRGTPMMIVQVTCEGADLLICECGTEKRPCD